MLLMSVFLPLTVLSDIVYKRKQNLKKKLKTGNI